MPAYGIEWTEDAKFDVRKLDRQVAMRIFDGILHYSRTGSGDIVALQGPLTGGYRLRIGDYRVLFLLDHSLLDQKVIRIVGVRHRSEAYR